MMNQRKVQKVHNSIVTYYANGLYHKASLQ